MRKTNRRKTEGKWTWHYGPKQPHPPPDTPQEKKQKTHLGDPQNYQVESIDIQIQEVAKSFQSRFFDKINSKTL